MNESEAWRSKYEKDMLAKDLEIEHLQRRLNDEEQTRIELLQNITDHEQTAEANLHTFIKMRTRAEMWRSGYVKQKCVNEKSKMVMGHVFKKYQELREEAARLEARVWYNETIEIGAGVSYQFPAVRVLVMDINHNQEANRLCNRQVTAHMAAKEEEIEEQVNEEAGSTTEEEAL
jgi:hypothetical protein